MPLPTNSLATVLRTKILALGAVPVLTANQIQQENALDLLWNQLLDLLSGLQMNEYLFRGAGTIVNLAVPTIFPTADGIVLDAVNFPIASVITVKMNGTLANTSAGAVRYQVGLGVGGVGGDVIQPNAVAIASGVVVANWNSEIRITRVDAANFRVIYSQFVVDGRTPGAGVGTGNLSVADGEPLIMLATMDTADALASITLNNATIQSEASFETIDT